MREPRYEQRGISSLGGGVLGLGVVRGGREGLSGTWRVLLTALSSDAIENSDEKIVERPEAEPGSQKDHD